MSSQEMNPDPGISSLAKGNVLQSTNVGWCQGSGLALIALRQNKILDFAHLWPA